MPWDPSKRFTSKEARKEAALVAQRAYGEKRTALANAAIKGIEDDLLMSSLAVLTPYMRFNELSFDEEGNIDDSNLPDDIKALPDADKRKAVRLMQAGWMPSAECPHGVKVAHLTVMGIMKARAQVESGTKVINIETAQFPAPRAIPEYGEIEVED